MSITAQDIINETAESIGVLGIGNTLPAEETDRFLRSLNTMIDGWNAERLMVYQVQDEQFTLTANTESVTVGAGGVWSTTRPQRIEWAFLRTNGAEYWLEQKGATEWAMDDSKTLAAGWPYAFYYEPSVPLGTLHFLGQSPSSIETHIGTWRQLTGFATSQTSVDMPPGYREALVTNLGVRMAPRYERPVPAEIGALAVASKRKLKVMNTQALTPQVSEAALLNGCGSGMNILAGR
ncbi:MAG TPA: hypothetical protein VF077_13315 [Nitrospiraceae bacterium]